MRANVLYKLLKKDTPWSWTTQQKDAYNDLRTCLRTEPVLLYIHLNKEFVLDTDASSHAVAAILQQCDENKQLKVVAYGSRSLRAAERKWHVREQEAFAIVWGIQYFDEFLRPCPKFVVNTDHQSLKWIWKDNKNKRVIRWALAMQEYNFEIRYRSASGQQHVDMFTRNIANDVTVPLLKRKCSLIEHLLFPLSWLWKRTPKAFLRCKK